MKPKEQGVNLDAGRSIVEADAELSFKRLDDFLGMEIDRMRRRMNGDEKPIPLPWQNANDSLGGGLWPGLTVLVGNTGTGKSQLALQAALAAALQGIPALYIGLELDRLGLVARFLALRSGVHGKPVHWSDLYLGNQDCKRRGGGSEINIGEVVEGKHRTELEKLGNGLPVPFYFEAGKPNGWDPSELGSLCNLLRTRHPEERDDDGNPIPGSAPFLIVLDFLQLVGQMYDPVTGEIFNESLRERIGKAAYAGRAAARDYNAAVVLVSSTSRENYARLTGEKKNGGEGDPLGKGSPSRFVGVGKESGEIEFAADTVLTLCCEGHPSENDIWLAVAKVRAGTNKDGWVRLRFDGTEFKEPGDNAGGSDNEDAPEWAR